MTTEYYLKNEVTGDEIILCDYSDTECIEALREDNFYMLSPADYGEDAYDYPAIYTPPGILWDQSEENKTNGDWTMMSREIDSGDGGGADGGDNTHGGDHDHGDGDHNHGDDSDMTENPVFVTYNDGRRNNTGMGLYYLGGSHDIGFGPFGIERNETPSTFIPLWMNEDQNMLPSFPRPDGAREGLTTGIIDYKDMHHVVFQDENGKFKKISFDVNDGVGIASSKGETKAKGKWINKAEIATATDINGDGIFGAAKDQTEGLSEGEYNNESFSNKLSDKKLLKQLRKGNMVIYLRHTTTEVDYADQADPDMSLKDCSTQRMLNEQGKAEAAAIGAGFEANDILIGKVITSQYCRAKETAEIAFGGYDKIDKKLNFLPSEDYTDEQLDIYHDRVAPMLSKGHKKGNKIIVGHDDPFEGTTNIYPDPQGTAYVLKPNNGDSYDLIARLLPDDWAFGADLSASASASASAS